MALLRKYDTPEHIVRHSIRVWQVGRILGAGLIRNKCSVDLNLLRAACLLHDIAKYPCIVSKKWGHDEEGRRMVREEGFPDVARVISQHVILRDDPALGLGEAHVLFYSDKRVVHDQIVTLEERFRYLLDTYGRNETAQQKLYQVKRSTCELETAIFRGLDFSPDDVVELAPADMAFP